MRLKPDCVASSCLNLCLLSSILRRLEQMSDRGWGWLEVQAARTENDGATMWSSRWSPRQPADGFELCQRFHWG